MLLDSNILIYGSNGRDPRIDAVLAKPNLSVASITTIETLGYHRLAVRQKNWLTIVFSKVHVMHPDTEIVERAILLRQQRKMSLADAIIAATALENNLPLVTRNINDFAHIAGLQIIDPFAKP